MGYAEPTMTAPRLRLGQLLVDARLITPEALDEVLEIQRSDPRRLGTLLVEQGLIDETQLTQILSHQLSVPWVSLLHIEFSRQLLNLVSPETADHYCLVPIYVRHVRGQGQTLYVAMEDPSNEEALEACARFSGLPARAMIAPPADIRNAIRVYYGGVAPEPAPAPGYRPGPSESSRARRSERPARRTSPLPFEAVQVPEDPPPMSERISSEPPSPRAPMTSAPEIEAVEIPFDLRGAKAVKALVEAERAASAESGEEVAPDAAGAPIPEPRGDAPRMVALTLLDGTSIRLPARGPGRDKAGARPPGEEVAELTARDLVAALRAVAHGADATEILGEDPRWEAMFAALLSLLLKKHLIADWEFVEQYRKI